MSPNGSVSRYRLPCFRTWTLPRSVACWMWGGRGSTNATPPAGWDAGAGSTAASARRGGVRRASSGGRAAAAGRAARVRDASRCWGIVSSGDRSESVGLVGHDEGIDEAVDLAVHDPRQSGQVEPDPVIGDPVLREVVRADLVRA